MTKLTQNAFYSVTKERIANLLNLPSSFDSRGAITCKSTTATIKLSDYTIPEHIISTPEEKSQTARICTRAEILTYDMSSEYNALKVLERVKSKLDSVVKQLEI